LLEKYDWFHVLHGNPVKFKNCVLAGIDYKTEQACNKTWLFPQTDFKIGNRKKILMVHPMVVNEPTLFIDGEFKQINVKEVDTTADVLLCGHYHFGFPNVIKGESLESRFNIVNPGSLARIDALQAKKTYGPALVHLKIGKKIKIETVQIPCKKRKKVFDLKAGKANKQEVVVKDNFIRTMKELSQTNVMGDNFIESLEKVLDNPPKKLRKIVNKKVIKLCRKKLEEMR